jgi:hypothetical protein
MEQLQGFDFFPLQFDDNGKLTSADLWKEFKQRAGVANGPTDAIFIAHGFRNDEGEARNLYDEFLKNFRGNMTQGPVAPALAGRRFIVGGVFWPSKAFKEEFGEEAAKEAGRVQSFGDGEDVEGDLEPVRAQLDELRDLAPDAAAKKRIEEAKAMLSSLANDPDAQDKFAKLVLSIVDKSNIDPSEGQDRVMRQPGHKLLDKLRTKIVLPTVKRRSEGGTQSVESEIGDVSDEGGTQSVRGFFGSVAGRVGQFLNLTSWYVMKDRSGKVGENGVAPCVRELRKEHPTLRIHLVGHSLGGRLMAACANALAKPPEVKVDSLTLLQAAFSHYGLSADNLHGSPGFFRDVIAKKVVTGPMVATFSFQDTVVGKAYAISSRLAGDNVKAIGDENDQYGGIGRNGAQNLDEFASERLRDVGSAYTLKPDIVQCLDGSGGLITSHGDVRNERVTWAFASAVAATK